jgi:pantoate--beta-alanine ligase
MLDVLSSEPLAETQYISIAELDTLEEVDGEIHKALLSMAVKIGTTRLIDNVILMDQGTVNQWTG